jgi:hypothetical protein
LAFSNCGLGIALAEAHIAFGLALFDGDIHARTFAVIKGRATESVIVVGAIFTLALETAIPAIVI